MGSIDWGPLPSLLSQLDASEPDAWTRHFRRPGGVWAAAALQSIREIWPPDYPAQQPDIPLFASRVKSSSLWARLVDWLRRWMTGQPASRKAICAAPDLARRQALLHESHVWAARRNLERLAPWFVPFWTDAPTILARVSGQGVVWVARVCHLDTRGTANVSLGSLPIACLGDSVALHLAIEDLVASLGARFTITADVARDRRPGGFRSQSFLRIMPWLSTSTDPDRAEWSRVISTLISQSPLTQLVYPEFVTRAEDVKTEAFSPLFKHYTAPEIPAVVSYAPILAKENLWIDLWLANLARSVLGGLLSPPPAFDAHAVARHRSELNPHDGKMRDEQARLAGMLDEQQRQRRTRLQLLSAVFAADAAFQIRWIDMVIRQIVSECAPRIVKAWKTDSTVFGAEARRRYLIDDDALCHAFFQEMMLGPSDASSETRLDHAQQLWDRLQAPAIESIHFTDLGLSAAAADRLTDSFSSRLVRLPVSQPGGYAPGTIWRNWMARLHTQLVRVQ